MSHAPHFTFRQHGGVCAGDTWIYDGEEPIARLENRVVEQPEQNLRYFDGNPKPVNLRDLKLAPGGRPLVCGVQMYWVFQHRVLATTELLDIQADGQESDRLTLTVTTADPGGVATSRRSLLLTYDPHIESYVYDFQCHLDIHSRKSSTARTRPDSSTAILGTMTYRGPRSSSRVGGRNATPTCSPRRRTVRSGRCRSTTWRQVSPRRRL